MPTTPGEWQRQEAVYRWRSPPNAPAPVSSASNRGVRRPTILVRGLLPALPNFLKVKELVDAGTIGEIRFVAIRLFQPIRPAERDAANLPWRVQPEIAGGGHFFDLASHQLDFLDYLFGPIVSAQGQATNQTGIYPAEDIVSANYAVSGVQDPASWCFTVERAPKSATPSDLREPGAHHALPPSARRSVRLEWDGLLNHFPSPTLSMCNNR
ncbi:MAG: Gfo/Idh/MocA family oxidoreductase [Caldilineaceae bacterium]